MTPVLAVVLAFLVGACGRPATSARDLAATDSSAAASLPDSALVRSSDPQLREMGEELLPDLARDAGLKLHRPVRIARRSRAQLERYLRAKLNRELPPERARSITESYALLGLVPEGMDLRKILLSVYTEQVAGFYDPDSTELFVMDDQPASSMRTLLTHELVHAVQDQTTNLDSLTSPDRGNDRQTAAQSAIEGHATVVMLEYLAEQREGGPVDLSQIPDISQRVRPSLESLRDQYPALAGAPDIIQQSLLFPYVEGAAFVLALWKSRKGTPAPFGPDLPQSTEQVLHPERLFGPHPDRPTTVVMTSEGAPPAYRNGLGEMETRVMLKVLTGREPAPDPLGWDGDAFDLFRDGKGSASLAWFSVWDDAGSRDAFVGALRPTLSKLPERATLEALDVQNRPGALLRVGSPPRVRIELEGGDDAGSGDAAGAGNSGGVGGAAHG